MKAHAPAAIRRDHDPFPTVETVWVGWRRQTVSPFALLRWTDFRCPWCHVVFRRDYLSHKVRLGSGERICNHCGKVFDDASREWPELLASEKFRCVLPPPLIGITLGLTFMLVLTLLMAARDQAGIRTLIMLIAVFLSPTLPWYFVRVYQIHQSIDRYKYEVASARRNLG